MFVGAIGYLIGWYFNDRMIQDRIRDRIMSISGIDLGRRNNVVELLGMLSPLSDEDLREVLVGH